MTNIHPWESDAAVDESVEVVRANLFSRLRARRPRHRVLVALCATVAGAGLFAGGIAFGAAAYASPSRAVASRISSTQTALTISCFASPKAKSRSWIQEYPTSGDPGSKLLLDAAKADPEQSCVTQLNQESELMAFGRELEKGNDSGVDCGVLTATSLPAFYFELEGGAFQESGGLGYSPAGVGFGVALLNGTELTTYVGSFTPPAKPLPSTCVTITLPPTTVVTSTMLGACSVDARHANVYVLGTESIAAVCKQHGYKIWRS